MHKNTTSSKFQLTVNEKRILREVMKNKRKIPLYPYFHPQALELFTLKFQLYG